VQFFALKHFKKYNQFFELVFNSVTAIFDKGVLGWQVKQYQCLGMYVVPAFWNASLKKRFFIVSTKMNENIKL
jgi:hypothetical protein